MQDDDVALLSLEDALKGYILAIKGEDLVILPLRMESYADLHPEIPTCLDAGSNPAISTGGDNEGVSLSLLFFNGLACCNKSSYLSQ